MFYCDKIVDNQLEISNFKGYITNVNQPGMINAQVSSEYFKENCDTYHPISNDKAACEAVDPSQKEKKKETNYSLTVKYYHDIMIKKFRDLRRVTPEWLRREIPASLVTSSLNSSLNSGVDPLEVEPTANAPLITSPKTNNQNEVGDSGIPINQNLCYKNRDFTNPMSHITEENSENSEVKQNVDGQNAQEKSTPEPNLKELRLEVNKDPNDNRLFKVSNGYTKEKKTVATTNYHEPNLGSTYYSNGTIIQSPPGLYFAPHLRDRHPSYESSYTTHSSNSSMHSYHSPVNNCSLSGSHGSFSSSRSPIPQPVVSKIPTSWQKPLEIKEFTSLSQQKTNMKITCQAFESLPDNIEKSSIGNGLSTKIRRVEMDHVLIATPNKGEEEKTGPEIQNNDQDEAPSKTLNHISQNTKIFEKSRKKRERSVSIHDRDLPSGKSDLKIRVKSDEINDLEDELSYETPLPSYSHLDEAFLKGFDEEDNFDEDRVDKGFVGGSAFFFEIFRKIGRKFFFKKKIDDSPPLPPHNLHPKTPRNGNPHPFLRLHKNV